MQKPSYMVPTQNRIALNTEHPPLPEAPPVYPPILKLVQFGFQTGGRLFPSYAGRQAYKLFATPRYRARHKQSDPLLEQAEIFDVLYGKILLKGYSWGEGDRVVLLVHGWESRGTALRHFVPALMDEGFRVVAFDGPGHGDSTGTSTNLIHFAGAIKALIQRLDGLHGMITHSFGGAASSFALSQARNSFQLSRLVCIAVPDSLLMVLQDAANTLALPKGVFQQFLGLIEQKFGASIQEAYTHKMGLKAKIDSALIVHDEQDSVVPFSEAETIFQAWDFASLLHSSGYGHYQLMKNPDLAQQVAQFIGN